MNFYEILKTKKLGRGSPDYWTQLFAEHVGGKGEWAVTTLTGTLPITFRANGTALINYKIYGTVDGAGVQTENLCGEYLDFYSLSSDGQVGKNPVYDLGIVAVEQGQRYYFLRQWGSGAVIYAYFTTKPVSGSVSFNNSRNVTNLVSGAIIAPITGYMAMSSIASDRHKLTIVKGSTAPGKYIPYGYKLPIEITSGTESKTADIYIGDTKLGEEEYVDYEEQKIWRKVANSYDKDATNVNNGYRSGSYLYFDGRTGTSPAFNVTEFIPTNDNKYGIISNMNTTIRSASICFYANGTFISGIEYNGQNIVEFEVPSNATHIRASVMIAMQDEATIYMSQYPTMITPTDPPLPLPELETFSGENTLDSTETLGAVTIKGQIKPQS